MISMIIALLVAGSIWWSGRTFPLVVKRIERVADAVAESWAITLSAVTSLRSRRFLCALAIAAAMAGLAIFRAPICLAVFAL